MTGLTFSLMLLLFTFLSVSNGFTINHLHNFQPLQSKAFSPTRLHAAPQSLEDLLSNESLWGPIKNELDQVPVFACANDQSQPLQYNVGDQPLAFFFVDIDSAKAELEKAKVETKLEGLKLVPFPLGEVYEMGAKQMAVIIPSVGALEDAGAPPGNNPIGQQVPLFGCMDVQNDFADGTSMTPLFTSMEEAKKAMDMALEGVEDTSMFDVTVMPLTRAIQLQASTPDISFTYVPPQSSLDFLRSMN